MKRAIIYFLLLGLAPLLWSCQSNTRQTAVQAQSQVTAPVTATAILAFNPTAQSTAIAAPPTLTAVPIATATATQLPTVTATATPTATPIGPCAQRIPNDGLLTFVTLEYGLSRDFAPGDLTPLVDYFPVEVTLGYPTEVRAVIVQPLVEMVTAMRAEGLRPFIISGYRSYSTQAIAWDKWNREYPERAAIISSPPGHSEHQLGTTLDFGSPQLADIVGEEYEFHTYFYKTDEGAWLLEHAHEYGFTLSYSREAFDVTGFYYEPWHFRYVGVDLATHLQESGMFLAQYLLDTQPLPCIP